MLIDGYFGIGFKLVSFRQWVYGYYYHNGTSDRYYREYNADHSPNLKTYNEWIPVVNCGIKIGVGF
jgi:hypothetical protein